ncbi:hypothetical protein LPJ61_002483 [Coemansia biformis]|uniref:Uncharacterized protein n=1 Tax=Coemansia biformis TaxID=1286918 RepID=A0A9W8CYM4_9FUNG|nr:hypothetical protein LPJ61_002483 [Coemansia biformis]
MAEAGVPPSRRFHDVHQSPVPSLTTETSRASSASASSSVTAMSPDSLMTTPRDLLPQFSAVGGDCGKRGVEQMVGAGAAPEIKSQPQQQHEQQSLKRRREGGADGSDAVESVGEEQPRQKRRVEAPVRRKQLTGDADFVKLLGLQPLYDAFVRPYSSGGERRALPDVDAAYLRDIEGAERRAGTVDLLGLVMAPPKNDLDRLELLPAATVRAAFRICGAADEREQGGSQAKRPRVALKVSGEGRVATPRHSGKVGIVYAAALRVN